MPKICHGGISSLGATNWIVKCKTENPAKKSVRVRTGLRIVCFIVSWIQSAFPHRVNCPQGYVNTPTMMYFAATRNGVPSGAPTMVLPVQSSGSAWSNLGVSSILDCFLRSGVPVLIPGTFLGCCGSHYVGNLSRLTFWETLLICA